MNTSDEYAAEISLLAGAPLDLTDQALLDQLRTLYEEFDPVPDGLIDRIKFELTLDALHAEVATMLTMDLAAAGVRAVAAEDVRTVTFTADSVSTMVTLAQADDDTVRVDGWAAVADGITATEIRVAVHFADSTREATASADGRFSFDGLPHGLVRFVIHVKRNGDSATVVTPSIEL